MTVTKKTVTVTLKVDELMYDIMNKTHLTGRAREAEGVDYKATSNMQASLDGENSYQLKRSLATSFTGLKSLLGEFINETGSTADNMIPTEIDKDSGGELSLEFKLPTNFSEASVGAMGEGVHAYIVDKTLAEWFAITNKADAKYYQEHSLESLAQVEKALYKRKRPERPTYSA